MDRYYCNDVPHNVPEWGEINYQLFRKHKIPALPLKHVIHKPFGTLLFYEYSTYSYTIQYCLFDITKSFRLTIMGNHVHPNLFINLWTPIDQSLNDGPIQRMQPHHYCLENKPYYKWEAYLKKGRQYSFMYIFFPPDKMAQLSGGASSLSHFSKCLPKKEPAKCPQEFIWCTPTMIQETYKMLHTPYPDPTKELYLENVVTSAILDGMANVERGGPKRRGLVEILG